MANNLLIDIGNTSVKWRLMDIYESPAMSQRQYPRVISEAFFTGLWKNIEKPGKVLVTCVANDDVWDALESAIDSLWSLKVERVIAAASGYGIINAYSNPADLGSDRWCALIGAYQAMNADTVVVSCGSALTIDVVTESGEHLGGYILPGISMMKQSLGIHTAQVTVDTTATQTDSLLPAKSTSGCVNVAAIFAAVSLIEAVLKQQAGKSPDVRCLLTGGDADLVAEHLTIEYVKMPDLVLRGLELIAENNQEQVD